MNYESIIELLLNELPNLKENLELDDNLNGLPHCIFEIVLIPFTKKLCMDSKQADLIRLGNFLEEMARCKDKRVNELLNVSFLEPIVLADNKIIPVLQNYLGKKSLEELAYWQKKYSLSSK